MKVLAVVVAIRGALIVLAVALALWWSLDPCTGWTDAELEACFGQEVEP